MNIIFTDYSLVSGDAFNYLLKYAKDFATFLNGNENKFNKSIKKFPFVFAYNPYTKSINTRYDFFQIRDSSDGIIKAPLTFSYENEDGTKYNEDLLCFFSTNQHINILADYMSLIANIFIISHEIAHLFKGHNQFIFGDNVKDIRLYADDNADSVGLDKLTYQTIEYDADTFAISQIIHRANYELINDAKIMRILKNKENLYKLVKIAIHGLLYLLRQDDIFDFRKEIEYEHPPIIIREALIFNSMGAVMEKYDDGFVLDDDFTSIVGIVEDVLINHTESISKKPSIPFDDIQYFNDCQKHCDLIFSHWKDKIRYDLKPFARVPVEVDF